MKKRKAIRELKEQRLQFLNKNFDNDSISGWKLKTGNMIIDYVGDNSSEYLSFYNFHFGEWTLDNKLPIKGTEEYRKHMGLISILDNCIETIKRKGVQSSPLIAIDTKSRIKNKHIATVVAIIGILIMLWIAYLQGAFDSIIDNYL